MFFFIKKQNHSQAGDIWMGQRKSVFVVRAYLTDTSPVLNIVGPPED